ncbi:sodium/solute symporter [Flagellimonas sp. CMM7]|uniref:sodium:solute symporter family transporter n=1 Tax=Flagellimonas sp. CMM7 TaxID=2654676 RepID=UPI0013D22BFC|nr:sodium/solute symporter [Flagellimonas sp. CMM7]UII80343.1 sodium/solute symporter [Flagellimonas sp. CMM7]
MEALGVSLSWVDLLVMAVYVIGIIWWGLKKGSSKTSEGYFLAGRSMTWPIIGISLFAANVSSSSLLSWSGDAYSSGIAVFNYGWVAVIPLLFFLVFILPVYLKKNVFTMPEWLGKRFDSRSRYYLASMNMVGYVFLDIAQALYAGALVVKLIFPQLEIWQIVWILAIAVATYTIPGGLSSVIHTEVLQAIILLLGSTLVTVFALNEAGGWAEVVKQTDPEMLSLIRPIDDESVPWLGIVLGIPLLGFYYWCTNQSIVQRTLSAKSINEGRKGALLASLLNFPILFIMVLPGIFGLLIYPEIERPDLILPHLIFGLLPIGIKGLMVTALLAAMASTLSAVLNSASTVFSYDFMPLVKSNLSNKAMVRSGKISALVMIIIASFWAPYIGQFDSIVKYFQSVLAYMAPPIVAVFLFGMFWKRVKGTAAFAGLMAGLVGAVFLVFFKDDTIMADWHFLLVAPVIFTLSCITIVLFTLALTKPDNRIEEWMWNKSYLEDDVLDGVAWYKNYRVLSVLLLIFTLFFVYLWR